MTSKPKRPLKSLYIHIPFCKDKCYYCNFISLVDKNNFMDQYIASLLVNIEQELSKHRVINLNSIYIGGGTPSLLEIHHFENILNKISKFFVLDKVSEITVEINPGTTSFSYLQCLRDLGVNRLSIGIQSFDDKILKLLNRKHNSDQAKQSILLAQKAGFENINLDLMYGLPDQTVEIWVNTLQEALNYDIKHISAYGLKIENDNLQIINQKSKKLKEFI